VTLRRNSGLTIVELIIVVVVLGIIAGVIYSKVLNKGVDKAKINLAFLEANRIKEAVENALMRGGLTDLDEIVSNPSVLQNVIGSSPCTECSYGIYCVCNSKTNTKYGVAFNTDDDIMMIYVECPDESFAEELEKVAKRAMDPLNVARTGSIVVLSYPLE